VLLKIAEDLACSLVLAVAHQGHGPKEPRLEHIARLGIPGNVCCELSGRRLCVSVAKMEHRERRWPLDKVGFEPFGAKRGRRPSGERRGHEHAQKEAQHRRRKAMRPAAQGNPRRSVTAGVETTWRPRAKRRRSVTAGVETTWRPRAKRRRSVTAGVETTWRPRAKRQRSVTAGVETTWGLRAKRQRSVTAGVETTWGLRKDLRWHVAARVQAMVR